jgi:hypothetical protein
MTTRETAGNSVGARTKRPMDNNKKFHDVVGCRHRPGDPLRAGDRGHLLLKDVSRRVRGP